MLHTWVPPVVALVYAGMLFGIAYAGDKHRWPARLLPAPLIYSLALGVYCTSWTFFGAVGRAASFGWEFAAIYLGPALVFAVLYKVPERIVRISKRQRLTSIADFIAARYGKSQALAVLVSTVALVAVLPYIALQLRAVSRSYEVLAGVPHEQMSKGPYLDGALVLAAVLALFTILFGTRQVDATESHRGMVLAIAAESAVKLLAFVAVGLYVVFGMFDGPGALWEAASRRPDVSGLYWPVNLGAPFLVHTVLAMLAIMCLPRQFHIAVVENRSRRDLAVARWAFPAYLGIFTLFVIPIALAGLLNLGGADADTFVLRLPLEQGNTALALLAFVGGFSAATGMVIVATIACSTMLSNEIVMPALLRWKGNWVPQGDQLPRFLIRVRRILVILILGLAWICYRIIGNYGALASIGLLSFVAVAQFGPPLLLGLFWKRATHQGAIVGLVLGFAIWVYTLLLPAAAQTGWFSSGFLEHGPAGIAWLKPYELMGLSGLDPITHGTIWSLGVNIVALVLISFWGVPGLLERRQAGIFGSQAALIPSYGLPPLKGTATTGDLRVLAERFVGAAKATSAFREYFAARQLEPTDGMRGDDAAVELTERLLSGAMGAVAARRVLASALKGGGLGLDDLASIVGSASRTSRFNRDLLEITLENIAEGISVVDAQLRIVAWNRSYEKMFLYPPELLRIGTPIAELIRYNAGLGRCGPGEVEEHVRRRLRHMRRGGGHVYQRVRQDGMVLEMRQNPLPGGGFVTSFSDVTAHKKIEQALIDSERNIRAYTDIVPVLIAFVDRDLRFRFVNRAYERAVGLPREQIIGQRADEVLTEQRFIERKDRMIAALAGERQNFEVESADTDGSRRYAEATYFPQRGEGGVVQGFFAVFHDITERRRAEIALQEAYGSLEQRVDERTRELSDLNERLRRENELRRGVEHALREATKAAETANLSKTRFLAAASQDLLQPLNAARLFTSALAQRELDESTRTSIQRIDSSLVAAEELLTTLLDISKLDAGALEPQIGEFSLQEIMTALSLQFSVVARERGLALHTIPSRLRVRTDRRFLRRILQNFLSNALRYTARGRVVLGCRRMSGAVRIEVWDTGAGIDESQREEIFEEFRRLQTKDQIGEKGMGLGLAIVRRMARALNHPVDVRSWPGKGSMFGVTVPVGKTKSRASRPGPKPRRPSGLLDGTRVLCVDNQADILEGMSQLLGGWGCEVICAASTVEALAAISDDCPHPDMVLADYQLDDGDTGLITLAAIGERFGDIPGAVITADHGDDIRILVRNAGYPMLRKPIRPAALRAMMHQLRAQRARSN
ncbi:MAG: NahK/ErcS family hybrid sensor histidine kinase/response regulator [Gammaproteobacteria bacterium]